MTICELLRARSDDSPPLHRLLSLRRAFGKSNLAAIADYRDDIDALNARIEALERDLADARAARPAGPLRCPYCKGEMVAGTLDPIHPLLGHRSDILNLVFRRKEGGAVENVDRAVAPSSDVYCADCSTVVMKGRFAD